MRIKFLVVSFFILVLNGLVLGQESNWFKKISEIKPGVSTKQDVESLFDSAVVGQTNQFVGNEQVYYKTEEGKLRVNYSLGNCNEVFGKVDLEKGKVIDFSFSPDLALKISKLNLDLTSFKKQKEYDNENWDYMNGELGIIYVLYKKKRLSYVAVSLTKEQREQYSCKVKN